MAKHEDITPPPTPKQVSPVNQGLVDEQSRKRKREHVKEDCTRKKWTVEDAKFVHRLKTEEKLSWNQIAEYFPGISPSGIESRYRQRLIGMCEEFTEDEKKKLMMVVDKHAKNFWREVGSEMGKSGKSCERIVKDEMKVKVEI